MLRADAPPRTYTIDALMAVGFSHRTLRYYRERGVLPPAHGRGPTAFYTDVHLEILHEIKRTRDNQRSLSDLAEHAHTKFRHAFHHIDKAHA